MKSYDTNRPYVTSVAFSPDGKRLALGLTQYQRPRAGPQAFEFLSGAVQIWDAATGEELQTLADIHHVNGVAFSSDGKRVASACLASKHCARGRAGLSSRRPSLSKPTKTSPRKTRAS